MSLPYGQQLPSLHARIAAHASEVDVNHLMNFIRRDNAEAIATMAERIGLGSPPAEPDGDDEFVERAPTRDEVLAYAAAMGVIFRHGLAHRPGPATPEELIDDLSVQPIRADAYDLIRSGFEDAALALMLAYEGYKGSVALEAIALVAPSLKGSNVAFVPMKAPYTEAVRDLPRDERIVARHGDGTAFGTVSESFGNRSYLQTGNALISLDSMHQVWRQVGAGGEEHRAHLSAALSGLADAGGRLRPGLSIADVVDALVAGKA